MDMHLNEGRKEIMYPQACFEYANLSSPHTEKSPVLCYRCKWDNLDVIFAHIAPVVLVDLRHVARIVRRNDRE